jgi:putative ABC transport system substrate-binding protein
MQSSHLKRRKFLTVVGGAAAWPLALRAQQAAKPMIGVLSSTSFESYAHLVLALHRGLTEAGYFVGQNVTIEYRWAKGSYERLPALADDLIRHQVGVIATMGGTVSALAAKAATPAIPIVFTIGGDPVKLGLVASLNRPGGNATGVSVLTTDVVAKRVELLHELLPAVTTIALLVNPKDPNAESDSSAVQVAGRALGIQIHVINSSNERDFDAAFATMMQLGVGALVVAADPFFNSRREQLTLLADYHRLPAVYPWREHVESGGLMSYGTSIEDAYRNAGIYTGRILKGAKPMDLPVQLATKVELVINLKMAKKLGITFPITLLGRADHVVE